MNSRKFFSENSRKIIRTTRLNKVRFSRMSFLAGLGISSDKPPIVLEIGSKFTKIGFSGEAGPRAIVHTPIDFENSNNDEIGEFLLWIYNIHLQISPRFVNLSEF